MFSNGTEFQGWQDAWCATCKKDLDESCEIVLRGLMREPTPEWGRGPYWSPQTVVYCTEYELVPEPTELSPSVLSEIAGQVSMLPHHTANCRVYDVPPSDCTCGRPA